MTDDLKRHEWKLPLSNWLRDQIDEVLSRYDVPSDVYNADVQIDALCVCAVDKIAAGSHALVAEAYELCVDEIHQECWTDGLHGAVTPELLAEQATTSLAIRAIRALTPADAIAAREADRKQVREQALREAADKLRDRHYEYMASKGRSPFDYTSKYSIAATELRALIEKDKTNDG